MNAISSRLSVHPERPIAGLTRNVMLLIDRLLKEADTPYMLVGATARDLILHHVFGERVTRATYDLDFAVWVDSWDRFESVKQLMLSRPDFRQDPHQAQRLYFKEDQDRSEIIVDVIPFGDLEKPPGQIAWPPRSDVVMNVVAFPDVYNSAVHVEVDSDLTITVPSLAGLMVLKLFAWLDRHDGRDVRDIRLLLDTYTDAGNFDRLYEEQEEQLTKDGFDTALSGAFLLGKDVLQITDDQVRRNLGELMTAQARSDLTMQLGRAKGVLEDRANTAEALLLRFFEGLSPL